MLVVSLMEIIALCNYFSSVFFDRLKRLRVLLFLSPRHFLELLSKLLKLWAISKLCTANDSTVSLCFFIKKGLCDFFTLHLIDLFIDRLITEVHSTLTAVWDLLLQVMELWNLKTSGKSWFFITLIFHSFDSVTQNTVTLFFFSQIIFMHLCFRIECRQGRTQNSKEISYCKILVLH